jgi:hypothetical protein
MNDDELERALRGWYRSEIGDDVVAPAELRSDLNAIASVRLRGGTFRSGQRSTTVLLAAAITSAAIVGSALVGSSLLRPSPSFRAPSLQPVTVGSLPPASVAVPSPSANATPIASESTILGGGPILGYAPHSAVPHCQTTQGPFDIVSVNPGTGARTLLGMTPDGCNVNSLSVQRSADGATVLVADKYGPELVPLHALTNAAANIAFACCVPYADVWEGGGGGGQEWQLSPRGDAMAAIHTARSRLGDGVFVAATDGTNPRVIRLPSHVDARGFAWSPDGTMIAVAGCRPCNGAPPGTTPTADERWHLYLVPLDDSGVRTLVDDASGSTTSQPSWAPDSSSIAVIATRCPKSQVLPYCHGRVDSTLELIDIASGQRRSLLSASDVGGSDRELMAPSWSPDGARIGLTVWREATDAVGTFAVDANGGNVVRVSEGHGRGWSPDSQWMLVARGPYAMDFWAMPLAGGDGHELDGLLGGDW